MAGVTFAAVGGHGDQTDPWAGKAVPLGSAPGQSMKGVRGTDPVSSGLTAYDQQGSVREGKLKFNLPVDSENKACEVRLYSFSGPHMRAFHLSWFGFFIAFCSTFCAAPLVPIIRNDLNMTSKDIGNGAAAAVTGTVGSRILMGMLCDIYGPRLAMAILLIGTSIPCFAMACATDAAGFIAARFFIGFSLATFVSCQYWCSTMFTAKIVGGANAIAGGWGNLGGGVTQIITPLITTALSVRYNNGNDFVAWREYYFIPGLLHILAGVLIALFGQDKPEGNVADLKKSGELKIGKDEAWKIYFYGLTNYRTWCLTFLYGFSFGVELVVDNMLAEYFFDQFGLSLTSAGLIASYSGLMNVCSRALGGILSDFVARSYGMRGRLWIFWLIQTASGGVCLAMSYESHHLGRSTATMVIFSFLTQMACGLTFGVTPFVSRRSLGVVSGLVGAGGNGISALMTYCYFTLDTSPERYVHGLYKLGITVMCATLLVVFIHFPMWGSMFFPGREDVSESDYYMKDYTAEEREAGKADHVLRFAENAKMERGQSVRKGSVNAPENAEAGEEEKAPETASPEKPAAV